MITLEQVQNALRTVHDPEIDHNVFDLGLIYNIDIDQTHVSITHTLTSVMCPFGEEICENIELAVAEIPGVTKVSRSLTFDPPFSIEMVPEETRLMMGWF
jgi:metal-sulfur cluster biosynthetic enzyme